MLQAQFRVVLMIHKLTTLFENIAKKSHLIKVKKNPIRITESGIFYKQLYFIF